MGLIWKAVLLLLTGYLLRIVLINIMFLEPWKFVLNHAPGPCRLVEGVVQGSEDIQTLPNGIALITSGLRFLQGIGNPKFAHIEGKVLLFDFKNPTKGVVPLKIVGQLDMKEFSPHGLYIYHNKKGESQVYIVNHLPSGERVEKFQLDLNTATLTHLKTIQDESFRMLNDLVVVGDDQFYISNCLHSRGEPGWSVEMFHVVTWGSVVFYDGQKGQVVDGGISMPNGVNQSPDGKYIYLTVVGEKAFRIYERNSDNTLRLKESVPLGTIADNIDVDPTTGDAWLGCQPSPWEGLLQMLHRQDFCTSQVLKLQIKDGHVTDVMEVYSDDGHRLHGASSTSRYGDAMLVGTVKSQLMYCELKYIGS